MQNAKCQILKFHYYLRFATNFACQFDQDAIYVVVKKNEPQ